MIEYTTILDFKSQLEKEDVQRLSSCIRKDGIRTAVFHDGKHLLHEFQFDVELPQYKISNQNETGRCWIYAALNAIRPQIIQKHNLKDICFSHNFIAFYDLLEKANYFLQVIIETINEDIESRILALKLQHPIQDAGQWFYFQNIIEKYGMVTQEAMPDCNHSKNTGELISVLSDILREDACEIRTEYRSKNKIDNYRIKEMLQVIYRILVLSLGEPPEKFDAELELSNGTVIREVSVTPKEFYQKYIHENYNEDYCMITNIPIENKPFYRRYKVSLLGNVWEAKKYSFLNLPMKEFKELTRKQLEEGLPVWFGCDSRLYSDRKKGFFSTDLFELKKLGYSSSLMNKEKNLLYGLSCLTHAMVIKGCAYEKSGQVYKWLVENSYGTKIGNQGYFMMTDEWFELFAYEVVIHKKFLEDLQKKIYEDSEIILPPWDVLGTLAD